MGSLWAEGLGDYRDQQRRSIVEAAERVFLRKGLAQASMTEIATEAGVSRPTLYKYFPTIDALALEVQMRALDLLHSTVKERIAAVQGSAIDELRAALAACLDFCRSNPQCIRFSSLFDCTYRNSYADPESAQRYAAFLERFADLERTIARGQAEGTIRSDLDVHNTALMIQNTLLAMMQRMALRGAMIGREQAVEPMAQLEAMVAMMLSYLQADAKEARA